MYYALPFYVWVQVATPFSPVQASYLHLLDFLLVGMDISWACRRWYSNINKVSCTTLLQDHISWVSSKQIPEGTKVCSQMSRIVLLHFALLPSLRILDFTISWSLQPRLFLTFTAPTSSSLFVSIRSSTAPALIGSLVNCVMRLSMHCRNFLDGLNPAVLSLQQIPGRLITPTWVWKLCQKFSSPS